VKAVRLTGPVALWTSAASLVATIGVILLLTWAGFFTSLTLDNPATYVLLPLVSLLVLACWPWSWARIDYLDEHGAPRTGYFTAASVLHRWTGRTRQLYEMARQQAEGRPSPPGPSP
jgi:hypothetical protein